MLTIVFNVLLVLGTYLPANAFSFDFNSSPTQCANATVEWTGGQAPYRLLLVPTGALHPEVRVIGDYTIPDGTSFSFVMTYPGNSTFVAVMSDATGFGTGGTTPVLTVETASSASCIKKAQVAPEFFIFTNPSVPSQCSPMEISYNSGAQPPVDIFAVVPGGQSSLVASGAPPNKTLEWTPTWAVETHVILVAGDRHGAGKGGSTDILTVSAGNSTSCLVSTNTTSTAPIPSQTHNAAISWDLRRSESRKKMMLVYIYNISDTGVSLLPFS